MADYLILGGGLVGCVIATQLKEKDPTANVTLLEAGPNEHENPLVLDPMGTFQMHNSRYEYNYATVPQKGYDGRQVYNAGGKQLSGSTAVNFAMWTRGGASDYDLWAELVGDKRWNYSGMLPYFRKTETHCDPETADPEQHGFDGPIITTSKARQYPLQEIMHMAFLKGTGLPAIVDANSGSPIGVAPYTENWHPKGYRQPAGRAYGLKGVEVVTNAQVHSILLDNNSIAKGAKLVDGRTFTATREVILCCGAIRTPQVLLLSGIGPAEELAKHGIKQLVNSPEVGLNFHDHVAMCQFYKVYLLSKRVI
jgi:choline dehydrogenase-like flavoprotein